jgi:hypothetical protein
MTAQEPQKAGHGDDKQRMVIEFGVYVFADDVEESVDVNPEQQFRYCGGERPGPVDERGALPYMSGYRSAVQSVANVMRRLRRSLRPRVAPE